MSSETIEIPNDAILPAVSAPTVQTRGKLEAYQKFVEFMAMPDPDKAELFGIPKVADGARKGQYERIPTLGDFALKYGVHRDTLTDWKRRADFGPGVLSQRISWGAKHTPNVLAALYRRCVTYGRGEDVETWLWLMEGLDRKKGAPLVQIDNFTMNDIRVLVAALPPEAQTKFHDTISSIIIEAQRNGISIDA